MTPHQTQAVALALRYGNREAARRMRISAQGIRALLREVYAEFGIIEPEKRSSGRNWLVVEAAIAAGWLTLPEVTP